MGTLENKARIEIRTGSDSDISKIQSAYALLDHLKVPYVQRILSAHRTPEEMAREARELEQDGYWVSIAGAGGSAHLAGMTASETAAPVVALPVYSNQFNGIDALLSMVQMPPAIPNGTVGPGGAEQAALYAAQIVGMVDFSVRRRVASHKEILSTNVPRRKLVGIVNAVDDAKPYQEVAKQLADFKISSDVYNSSTGLSVRGPINEWDAAGVHAIIVVYDRSNASLAPLFAQHTDIPVVAVAASTGTHPRDVIGSLLAPALDFIPYEPNGEFLKRAVASVGVDRFGNAALYAAQIIGIQHADVRAAFKDFRKGKHDEVVAKDIALLTKQGIEPRK